MYFQGQQIYRASCIAKWCPVLWYLFPLWFRHNDLLLVRQQFEANVNNWEKKIMLHVLAFCVKGQIARKELLVTSSCHLEQEILKLGTMDILDPSVLWWGDCPVYHVVLSCLPGLDSLGVSSIHTSWQPKCLQVMPDEPWGAKITHNWEPLGYTRGAVPCGINSLCVADTAFLSALSSIGLPPNWKPMRFVPGGWWLLTSQCTWGLEKLRAPGFPTAFQFLHVLS